jgi:hypothetical protein
MSGNSKVGHRGVDEAGNQIASKMDDSNPSRFDEGKPNAHKLNDSSTDVKVMAGYG